VSVIWHDLECGGYLEDLPLWRELAHQHGGPVLDLGAGTGRVSIDLARHGHEVVALDLDPELLAELRRRAGDLALSTVVGDARDFAVHRRFGLIIAPMQTVQLLGGRAGREGFLRSSRAHLAAGGRIAVAIAEAIDVYEVTEGGPGPLPDVLEREGAVYFSQPTAIRADEQGFVLERRREQVTPDGQRAVQEDRIRLDRLSAEMLEDEARALGLRSAGRRYIEATDDHVGSTVVMLGG
jgi:SAM-dependent methyltransferase